MVKILICVGITILVGILSNWNSFASGSVFEEVKELDCTEWRCSESLNANSDKPLCHCDKSCMLYGDCCYNFYDKKFSEENTTEFLYDFQVSIKDQLDSNPFEAYWINFVNEYGSCEHNFGIFKSESYIVVNHCPDGVDEELVHKCEESSEDFMSEVPVSYIGLGKVQVAFRNMYCSLCHKIPQEDIIPWSVSIRRNCTEESESDSSVRKVLPLNVISPTCIDVKRRPEIENPFRFVCFRDYSDICKDKGTEEAVESELLCDTYYHGVTVNVSGTDFHFKNIHCIPCSSQKNNSKVTCYEPDNKRGHASLDEKLDVNLVVLFDFRRGLSVEVNQNVYVRTEDLCGSNYIYDTILETCIEVICPDSQRLSSSGCIYNEASWNILSGSLTDLPYNKTYQMISHMETPILISDTQLQLIKTTFAQDDRELVSIELYYELLGEQSSFSEEETNTRSLRKGNKGDDTDKESDAKSLFTTTTPASRMGDKDDTAVKHNAPSSTTTEINENDATTPDSRSGNKDKTGVEKNEVTPSSTSSHVNEMETTTHTSSSVKKDDADAKSIISSTTQHVQYFEQSTTSSYDKNSFTGAQININNTENSTATDVDSIESTTSTPNQDTSQTIYVYEMKVIIERKSQINGELDKILESLSSLPETKISYIKLKNLNMLLDCDTADEEYVNMDSVVKLNGFYYGIDNASRALVDIDMTEFEINFDNGKITFSKMNYCKENSLNCTMGLYKISDFTFLDSGALINKVSNRVYDKQNYLLRDKNVLICINLSATVQTQTSLLVSKHESLLSIIVESISVFCLYTTGILYSGCFGIRTCNSRSIMFLSFTLGTAQCLFFISANTGITCKIKGVALHFFWISSFFWMSVIGFDYAKTFRIGKVEIRKMDKSVDLKYTLFAYGIPLAFIITCVCIDELVPGHFIGYGIDVCWIGKTNAYFIVFAIPVLCIIFVNISFFTCTVIGIKRATFTGDVRTTTNKSLMIVYIKICLIMGLTWVIAFVAGYFDLEFLWFVHIMMNGLQGLDIFLTFVLNKRTIQALRNTNAKKYNPTDKQPVSSKDSANSVSSTSSNACTCTCNTNDNKF